MKKLNFISNQDKQAFQSLCPHLPEYISIVRHYDLLLFNYGGRGILVVFNPVVSRKDYNSMIPWLAPKATGIFIN